VALENGRVAFAHQLGSGLFKQQACGLAASPGFGRFEVTEPAAGAGLGHRVLGATVGQVVATPDGDQIESTSLFANLYYDFNREGLISPYVGAGIGYSDVSVQYSPSGVGIIDDSEGKLAYQLKAGATWSVSERIDLYGEAAYRATDDVKLENALFPGTLNIENTQTVFSVGARYRFGS